MNELLKQIGIDAEPVKGEDGSYNIDIEDTVSILQSALAGLIFVWLALNLLKCWNLLA